eukprot:Seg464.1 transcript_id=Seg464.1/GoldUCD/mRNA.D3Y31 product="hypothetical protein" protein_id=Seg464.1/GoldUCD/D3Y31
MTLCAVTDVKRYRLLISSGLMFCQNSPMPVLIALMVPCGFVTMTNFAVLVNISSKLSLDTLHCDPNSASISHTSPSFESSPLTASSTFLRCRHGSKARKEGINASSCGKLRMLIMEACASWVGKVPRATNWCVISRPSAVSIGAVSDGLPRITNCE